MKVTDYDQFTIKTEIKLGIDLHDAYKFISEKWNCDRILVEREFSDTEIPLIVLSMLDFTFSVDGENAQYIKRNAYERLRKRRGFGKEKQK